MNTRSVNAAAELIQAALAQGRTAVGVALALESAQLLQSPEKAVEFEQMQARIAELELERHSTNEALDDAVQELRARRDEGASHVSRPLPPRDAVCARPGCGHSGESHHRGDTKCWAILPRTRQRDGVWSAVRICDCSGFVASMGVPSEEQDQAAELEAASVDRSVEKLTRLLAPSPVEDPHDSPLHHRYVLGRDLPPMGGAR
ncbi:hypothetical protein DV517_61640 [Streptomyces sp. S816]|uniref:hypothetical protein n=1 Tax=Streptomyces sp. S816 TaxID=2283197 RepID=UPI00109C4629|nr:hypothetical protein [Streptomyces sp. S816]TGZ14681.1 hypothetical protein DV517_61640 [Streptomyces sp. S816]